MQSEPSSVVALADAVSALLYAIAGWLLVVVGLMITATAARVVLEVGVTTQTIAAGTMLAIIGMVMILLGVFVNPRFRKRLDRRHGLSTFGRVQSVDRRVIRSDEDCYKRCVDCQSPIDQGLVRRYREEYALAGIPVYTRSVGYNHYCLACATEELFGPEPASTTTERHREPIVERANDR